MSSLIGVSLAVVLIAAVLIMAVAKGRGQGQLQQKRGIPTVGVQIVCGDCAGDDRIPYKTYQGEDGACHRCGGRSYILATTLAFNQWQYKQSGQNTKKLSFETVEPGKQIMPVRQQEASS